MIRSLCAAAIASALAAGATAQAGAASGVCPESIPVGNSVGGGPDAAHAVTAVIAVSALSPEGDVNLQRFGYAYTTYGAGAYLEDGHPHGWIVAIDGTDAASIRKGLVKLHDTLPPSKLSAGAQAVVTQDWKIVAAACAPAQ
jgi:hypothetical protein